MEKVNKKRHSGGRAKGIRKTLYKFPEVKNFIYTAMKIIPDETYLKMLYRIKIGEKLNLSTPQTFNEKLQWLKLHDRKPEYTKMVDKLEVKKYVSELIGEQYIIPTLGVWDNFDNIDFNSLPNQFVLKCTHDSGGLVICKDKKSLDKTAAKSKIEMALKRNFYYVAREWPYKNVKPRIIAEEYMADSGKKNGDVVDDNLTDYKIFCFDGVPKLIMTVRDRQLGSGKSLHRIYDTDWNITDIDLDHRGGEKVSEARPDQLNEMLNIASVLSKGIKHLRVDLYIVDGKIFFGELTFYHMSGFENWYPKEWNKKLGEYL
jgi:hypothetical protein